MLNNDSNRDTFFSSINRVTKEDRDLIYSLLRLVLSFSTNYIAQLCYFFYWMYNA